MSLRVLLADESASIRKVFQMGLQDFGADVKSVHNGLDVIEVAENYKPHIIFADILLQKKNGYEVSIELQKHSSLSQVPIVLMWSSFMELDHKKYESCGAHGELEKPFDVETMRALISELVELTKSQQISQFLDFPENIKREFVEDERAPGAPPQDSHAEPTNDFQISSPESEEALLNLEDSDANTFANPESESVFNLQVEDSEFDMSELEKIPTPQKTEEEVLEISDGGDWTAQPLSDQTLPPPTQTETDQDLDQFQSMNLQGDKKLNLDDFLYKPETETSTTPPPAPKMETTTAEIGEVRVTSPLTTEVKIQNVQMSPEHTKTNSISSEEADIIIRQEARSLLKASIDEQLPKILEKVIREELHKILEQEMALKAPNKNL